MKRQARAIVYELAALPLAMRDNIAVFSLLSRDTTTRPRVPEEEWHISLRLCCHAMAAIPRHQGF